MSSITRKELLTSIRRLALAATTVVAIGLFYIEFASKSHATEPAAQVRASQPTGAIAPKPMSEATVTIEGFEFQPNSVTLLLLRNSPGIKGKITVVD